MVHATCKEATKEEGVCFRSIGLKLMLVLAECHPNTLPKTLPRYSYLVDPFKKYRLSLPIPTK